MKKSEIYNLATMAVIDCNNLLPSQKLNIVHELSAEYRVALMCEEHKAKEAQEDKA